MKRIVASLEAVQFAADGEPFTANSVDVNSDFDDIGGDDNITTEDVEGRVYHVIHPEALAL